MIKKFLVMAFMLCVCTGIHAAVGATAVAAPCDGVKNKTFMGEATPEQIKKAQEELRKECDELAKKQAKDLNN